MTSLTADALEVLGDLERNEARLLTWGVVDAAMAEEEVLACIQASVEYRDADVDLEELFNTLLEAGLLLEARDVGPEHYRTRMAEAVRLFARLRQWLHGRTWMAAPNLVADFRFSLRPRIYPRRDLSPQSAIATLDGRLTDRRRDALEALLASGSSHAERKLATFQAEAAQRILRGLAAGRAGGTIVTAGTGSGKTLAFYLPALSWLSEHLGSPPAARIVAIYPRNELLKDQLGQCLAEIDRMGTLGERPIRVGTLFGQTPTTAKHVVGKYAPWEHHGSGGRVCPYLQCPRCRGPVIWPDADREASAPIERLVCTAPTCTWQGTEAALPITREALKRQPADILFTTTEMLNRVMSHREFRSVIGTDGRRRPALMLLDEVHTYGGTSGAHVAHLLRRWHHAAGGQVQFVGLSATLRDAAGFFSALTGLRDDLVREIAPAPHTMTHQGMEYVLALRGNPMAQTALLSTTIQALMLSARIVDPRGLERVAGSRVFAFTDKLDIANRLFHFYSDAEGWGPFGRPSPREPLASLRAPDRVDGERDLARAAGQVWDAATDIGHDLTGSRVQVGLTTSQQSGVQDRDVIVATAALEVGYNDEHVGLVLQHKAPRDPAAFLQRRGRAGRRPQQRPWTVAVLSDYGRDRIAYQAYEQLFDPSLPARSLPVANQAVRRMQAAFATLDWLSRKRQIGYSVWDDLTRPRSQRAQSALAELVERVLTDQAAGQELKRHLIDALRIDGDDADALLWTPPRGILTEVLPTALRRLQSGWHHVVAGAGGDLQAPTSPLPDFVPPNLFSDLQLPEVTVTTPKRKDSAEVDEHPLPVLTALTEFAPGNVSFRYALEGAWAASWVPIDTAVEMDGEWRLNLESFCVTYDELAPMTTDDGPLRVLRPWRLRTLRRPQQVLDTSRGWLVWAGGPIATDPATHVDLPRGTNWDQVIRRAESHLHTTQSAVKVRRHADSFVADIGYQGGEREYVAGRFVAGEDRAAVGFEYDADALAFHIEVPTMGLLPEAAERQRLAAFRTAWFAERLGRDRALDGLASSFQREQLERAYLATIADLALDADTGLQAARLAVRAEFSQRLTDALDALYDTQDTLTAPSRGLDDLKDLAHEPAVATALDRAAEALTEPLEPDAEEWARERFGASLAAALADASQALCREFDLEAEVVVDIERTTADANVVWLVERSPGGGGVTETVVRRILERPRHFLALLDRAVQPSDFEVVDVALRDVLDQAVVDGSPVHSAFAHYRAATSNDERVSALEEIRTRLTEIGVPAVHSVIAAIAARLIRFGSSAATDEAIHLLARRWNDAEETLAIELDPAVFAFTQRKNADVDALVPDTAQALERRRLGAVASTLWIRGWRARAEGLSTYSPYKESPPTDRLALEHFRGVAAAPIDLDASEWRTRADGQLRERGLCVIEHADPAKVAGALRNVTAVPTDTGALLLHPTVAALEATRSTSRATLILDDGTLT